jgi:hypothetical protein
MPMPAIRRARFRVATVEVFARRKPENPELVKVTEARLTYVAIHAFEAKRHIAAV